MNGSRSATCPCTTTPGRSSSARISGGRFGTDNVQHADIRQGLAHDRKHGGDEPLDRVDVRLVRNPPTKTRSPARRRTGPIPAPCARSTPRRCAPRDQLAQERRLRVTDHPGHVAGGDQFQLHSPRPLRALREHPILFAAPRGAVPGRSGGQQCRRRDGPAGRTCVRRRGRRPRRSTDWPPRRRVSPPPSAATARCSGRRAGTRPRHRAAGAPRWPGPPRRCRGCGRRRRSGRRSMSMMPTRRMEAESTSGRGVSLSTTSTVVPGDDGPRRRPACPEQGAT